VLDRTAASLPELRRESAELHELLLAPHTAAIARRGRLLVLADGPLLQLPFAALFDRDSGRYAVESWPIAQVESLGALALERRDSSELATRRALVIADPMRDDAALPGLPALPGAQAEARRVRRVLGAQAVLLTGAIASESRIKREAGSVGLLHFAVHGVLDDAVPLDSALILGRDGDDDGALRVREILGSLRLQADLVVLSACNTAVDAESRGDGLVSLTRAFRQAGAARVVATLWPIADHGAAELMGRFHRALASGASADSALREAQMALIGAAASPTQADSPPRGVGGLARRGDEAEVNLSHPFYWAGFQVYGRPERVPGATSPR
jgi:CHAT domain-containing protein